MNDCLFCKIIKGDEPCTKVYEDAFSFAFLNTHPNTHGHTVVIPKRHCRNMLDMEEVTASTLALAVRRVSKGVHEGLKAEGINIIMNNEAPAGQAVFHAHFHVIPRFANDGLKVWDKDTPYQEGETKNVADDIMKKIEK
jgi:histidine triad (HIT) family protein